ncbi:Protein kinase domain-containing protein [Friedmanniella luteola]|uniref:non-specific serine/threonine protein kinase n=1 Tax=Friedmanniella luteola TaxID=546871 RepID=A0A1H2AD91_9ACTN|nr:serine/threonine-protein kinase [Friedmanniella luteola]SDT43827.1 Protein kinase domain-containing protein [Friedmanniella luteola]
MAIEPPQIPGLTDWRPLARGGFAVVWEARQATLDRLVAVKVDQRRLDVESERLRFLREAGAAGQMSAHPGIVTVHDAGILADDRPYIVMELCPGGSLTRYLAAADRPSEERVREIGVRIADALAATHARGVLHRDVKPANILVDAYDRVGLADFGLAALPGPDTSRAEAFEGVTPAYTAPEALLRRPPTPAGDVYSLAATLYALLAGRPPRWPAGPTPGLADVVAAQREPLAPLPDVDPGLMAVLGEALDLDPAARPTAAGLRDRLAALPLSGDTPDGDEPSAVVAQADTGTEPDSGRRRTRALVLPLVGLVLVALLVAGLLLVDRGPGTAAPAATPPPVGSSAAPEPTTDGSSTPPGADPSPSPTTAGPTRGAALPAGYDDCSAELGGTSYCPTEPECWAGIISVFDLPSLGTPRDCDETHVYQTFAAGPLDVEVRRQSQLEELRAVRQICDADVLDRRLTDADRETDWEVLALPPQEADGSDRVYRCLFGRGDRDAPVELTAG